MHAVAQDLRFAFRMLIKNPVFTIAAILCLGLGIGANGAILPFFFGIVVNPLPFEEPDRLVFIQESARERGYNRMSVAYPDFADWREQNQAFSGIAAFGWASFTLTGEGEPEEFPGAVVSYNMPELLGKQPVAGRGFRPEEDVPGAERVALIGQGLWQRRFGEDPDLLGKTVMLDGSPHTVIGIMPHEFRFPEFAEIWVPLRRSPVENRGSHSLSAVGRMKPGVTIDQAIADLESIARALAEEYPETNSDIGIYMTSLKKWFREGEEEAAVIFYGVVCFILLLACANIANLLLARSAARSQEIAVRATLGAGRGRIVGQLITESILLAMMGGVLGFVLARIGRDLTLAGIPVDIPPYLKFDMDAWVILSLVAITAFCGLLFGLAPAIGAAKQNLSDTLRSGSGKTSGGVKKNRFRSFLVSLEITLALTVLIGACLMMKGFLHLKTVDPGFEPQNLLKVDISLSGERYEESQPRVDFYRDLRERIRTMPGVVNASLVSDLPDGYVGWSQSLYIEGTEPPPPGQSPFWYHQVAAPGYFSTMEIPLLQGRDFDKTDVGEGTTQVLILNEAFVQRFWPEEDPIGKRLCYGDGPPEEGESWMEVIGVVGNTHNAGYDNPVRPAIFRPHAQYAVTYLNLVIRTTADPLTMVDHVRQEIWALDPDLPLANIQTMQRVIQEANWGQTLFAWLFGVFSVIAIVLASVGIYGVVSYSVSQRSREFGIRMALGAGPGRVVRLVVRQGLILSALGLVAGVGIALLVMRFVSSIMFGVSPTDLGIYSLATLLMGAVSVFASYIPARRATRVDPVDALRYEQ